MPTYEFRCPNGHDFENFYRSISGAPREVACPTCGAIAERQLSGGAGLVFKGSGFYITDYGKDGKKAQNAPPGGKTESSGSESKSTESKPTSEAKSAETKPAAKPETKSTDKSKSGE